MPGKIEIVAHPPERRRRGTTLLASGCCCCCCCCLHSVGSVVGALVGGAKPRQDNLEIRSAEKYAVKIYWLSVLAVAIVTLIATALENHRGGEGLLIALFVIGVGLPGGQLIASVLTLIYLNVFPHSRKTESLQRLGRITLYSFIGGLIGTAVMVAMIPVFK